MPTANCQLLLMPDIDLTQLRSDKWRLNGIPARTIEDARSFLESVGFCMMYPQRNTVLAPTFIGAWVGSDENLPTWQHAFADPRAQEATTLMVRMLREHDAYEANLFNENALLIASSIFPYFYALSGDRNPKQAPKAGPRSEYSQLAVDTFALIQRKGPISKQQMREDLGGSVSLVALDRALGELWSRLRITRVDYDNSGGSSWDVLYRWSPDAVREGMEISVGEALSFLISKYLDCVIAADQQEIELFFGNFVPRSRVKDSVNLLLNARELSHVRVGNRLLVQITPAKSAVVHAPIPRPKPVARRPSEQRAPARFSSSKPSGPRPPGLRPVGTRPAGSRPSGPRPSGPRPPSSRPSGPRFSDSKPSGSRPPSSRPSGPRPAGSKFSGPRSSRPSGPRPPGSRPSGPRSPGSKPRGPRPPQRRP
jgi:23S rRNA pseudouridine2605 synthase